MGFEGRQVARRFSKFNLVIAFLEINLRKELGPIQVLEDFF